MVCSYPDICILPLSEPVKVVPCLFSEFIGKVGITNTKGISGIPSHRIVVIVICEPDQVVPCQLFVFIGNVEPPVLITSADFKTVSIKSAPHTTAPYLRNKYYNFITKL